MLWKFRSPTDADECRTAIQEAAHEEGLLTDYIYAEAAIFRVRDGELEVRFKRSQCFRRSRGDGVILYNWYRLRLSREPSGGTLLSVEERPGRTRGWWVFAAFVAVLGLLVEHFSFAPGPGPRFEPAPPEVPIFAAGFFQILQFFFSAIATSRREAGDRESLASFLSQVVDARRVDGPDAKLATRS